MGQSNRSITFTAAVGATAAVGSWKLIPSHGAIIGEYYHDHFLTVGDKSDEYIFTLVK